MTPSTSSRFIIASSPVVAVIAALFGLTPVANALGDGSSMTYTSGFGSPSPIASPSTMLCSCAYCCGSAGRAPETASTKRAPDDSANSVASNANSPAITMPAMIAWGWVPVTDPSGFVREG